jgi:hypothetical protein
MYTHTHTHTHTVPRYHGTTVQDAAECELANVHRATATRWQGGREVIWREHSRCHDDADPPLMGVPGRLPETPCAVGVVDLLPARGIVTAGDAVPFPAGLSGAALTAAAAPPLSPSGYAPPCAAVCHAKRPRLAVLSRELSSRLLSSAEAINPPAPSPSTDMRNLLILVQRQASA